MPMKRIMETSKMALQADGQARRPPFDSWNPCERWMERANSTHVYHGKCAPPLYIYNINNNNIQ